MHHAVARALLPVVVLGLLAGCTPAPAPVPFATAVPSPSATVDAPVPPDEIVAFDGDCDALVPADVIASALQAEAGGVELLDRDAPPEQLLGALSCWWAGGAGALYVTAAPRSVIDASRREEYAEYRCGAFWICGRAVEQGDLWLNAELDLGSPDVETDDSWHAPVDAVLAALQAAASLRPEAAPAERRDGWWSPLLGCERFLDSGAVGRILGSEEILPHWPTGSWPPGPLAIAVTERGLSLDCSWVVEDGTADRGYVGADLTVMPGAGRLVGDLLDERAAQAADVAGADRSGTVVGESDRTLYAVVGENAVRLYTWSVDDDTLALLAGEALTAPAP